MWLSCLCVHICTRIKVEEFCRTLTGPLCIMKRLRSNSESQTPHFNLGIHPPPGQPGALSALAPQYRKSGRKYRDLRHLYRFVAEAHDPVLSRLGTQREENRLNGTFGGLDAAMSAGIGRKESLSCPTSSSTASVSAVRSSSGPIPTEEANMKASKEYVRAKKNSPSCYRPLHKLKLGRLF